MNQRMIAVGVLFFALRGVATLALADTADKRDVDTAKSIAEFRVQHIFVEHVSGTVPIVNGSVLLAAGSMIPLSVTATLDATRIHTDEPDRDSALRSTDYFDTAAFPAWTFVSTKIVATGLAAYGIDGLLTIHGVTQPEHLDAIVRGDTAHPAFHAVAHIDRHAFGMKGGRLDPVIGNDADVTLDIFLK